MIEPKGAKHAYLYSYAAIHRRPGYTSVCHDRSFDVADSDDEAYGRAMKVAQAVFPAADGWSGHFAHAVKISGIDWVGRFDLNRVKVADVPGEGGSR